MYVPPSMGLPHAIAGRKRHSLAAATAAASSAGSTLARTSTSDTEPSAATMKRSFSFPSIPSARAAAVYSISVLDTGAGLVGSSVHGASPVAPEPAAGPSPSASRTRLVRDDDTADATLAGAAAA